LSKPVNKAIKDSSRKQQLKINTTGKGDRSVQIYNGKSSTRSDWQEVCSGNKHETEISRVLLPSRNWSIFPIAVSQAGVGSGGNTAERSVRQQHTPDCRALAAVCRVMLKGKKWGWSCG